MDLSAFRSRRALDALTVGAVGAALAAATAAVFRLGFSGGGGNIVLITALPTLVLGTVWAMLLRWRATLSKSKLRVGWVLSIPLAALNGGIACGLLFAAEGRSEVLVRFLGGLVLGATFGAMFWIPGLILTLLVFGLPIARAQRLSAQGLAGQERGDGFVGAASAAIALLALASTLLTVPRDGGVWLLRGLAVAAAALGGATLATSAWRERLRRAFVADVEAGRVEHFRVDATAQGKVLVRVVTQGEGYRVADYAEEVAALDREGSVTRGLRGDT